RRVARRESARGRRRRRTADAGTSRSRVRRAGDACVEFLNLHDYEAAARDRLDLNAWEYFRGGAGDEITMRKNRAAFERLTLRPRVLVDVGSVDTRKVGRAAGRER